MKWADLFFEELRAKSVYCEVTKRMNGWPETMIILDKEFFVKSITYNTTRCLYFQGVDPKKLKDKGDFVLLCGGTKNTSELRDIFIIPWKDFFQTLKQGELVNTYRPPREYWQYKFKIKKNNGKWFMTVQGSSNPEKDVSNWRYNSNEAIEQLK
ncbi:MAG: hypothetical protein V1794_17505 [Candidatus Glassbacteria bacterium]